MEIFADGIMNVVLTRGLVRIDWYSLSATEVEPDGTPRPEFRHRLLIHPDNLPHVLESLRLAVDALTEKGVLRPAMPAPRKQEVEVRFDAASEPAESADAKIVQGSSDGRPRSRNFPSTLDLREDASR